MRLVPDKQQAPGTTEMGAKLPMAVLCPVSVVQRNFKLTDYR
jgi:hypothetical protein